MLQHQFIVYQNDHWKDEDKTCYVERVIKIINHSPNSNRDIKYHGEALLTFYNKSKIEDYDDLSWHMVRSKFYDKQMRSGIDYRINFLFQEQIEIMQQKITTIFSLIAAMKNNEEDAFNMPASNILTTEVWIGDTGASCHMQSSIAGMFDFKPGSGGIKVGSGIS